MQLLETFATDALGCAATRRRLGPSGIIRILAMFIVAASAVAQQTTKDLRDASLEELTNIQVYSASKYFDPGRPEDPENAIQQDGRSVRIKLTGRF